MAQTERSDDGAVKKNYNCGDRVIAERQRSGEGVVEEIYKSHVGVV